MTKSNKQKRSLFLTDRGRAKFENAIAARFPTSLFPEIYKGRGNNAYNCSALSTQLQIHHPTGFFLNGDTLRKVLHGTSPVDLSSLEEVASALKVTLAEEDYESKLHSRVEKNIEASSFSNDFCNLPQREYPEFVGRQSDLTKLLNCLDHSYRSHIITIDGIGGLGKTTLAIEAAYYCLAARNGYKLLNAPVYRAIVFTTFKENFILPGDIVGRGPLIQSHLEELFRQIGDVLEDESIKRAGSDDQWNRVRNRLSKFSTLLIIDDFQTPSLTEQSRIMAFLANLPQGCKAIITTRQQRLGYASIRLDCLNEDEGIQFIEKHAKHKEIELSRADMKRLHTCFHGIPVALVYALGKMKLSGADQESFLTDDCPVLRDTAVGYCFSSSVKPLRGRLSYNFLIATAVFHDPPVRDALVCVAGAEEHPGSVINEALEELGTLSLVQSQQSRYEMISVTREYTVAEMSNCPEIVEGMRERWIRWYKGFAKRRGGTDWGDWSENYDCVQQEWENCLSVLYWCAAQERYEDVKTLWESLNHFSDLYGFWGERLTWLDWLIERARVTEDWKTHVLCLARKGWTLTMMSQPKHLDDAYELLSKAWDDRFLTKDLLVEDYVAHNFAVFLIRRKQYEEAKQVLVEKQKITSNLSKKLESDNRVLIRCKLNTMRNYAKINFDLGNLNQAWSEYQEIVSLSDTISWKRGACYARNLLANIAIKQCNWNEAKKFLREGMPTAQKNKNKRRLAFYQKSFAEMELKKGNQQDALIWLNKAREGFSTLGMSNEEEEIKRMIPD